MPPVGGRAGDKLCQKRMVMVFHNGDEKLVWRDMTSAAAATTTLSTGRQKGRSTIDRGVPCTSLVGIPELTAKERHPFGAMLNVLKEGEIYKRSFLIASKTFSNHHGGVSGTKDHGCSAIVVKRQNAALLEKDTFQYLRYSATNTQGARALIKSEQ